MCKSSSAGQMLLDFMVPHNSFAFNTAFKDVPTANDTTFWKSICAAKGRPKGFPTFGESVQILL